MPKPNFVLILPDSLGANAVGCYGNSTVQTPNIDALAKEGVQLNQCFAQSGVCMPSRATLLTGKYPGCHPSRYNSVIRVPFGHTTFASVLRDNGYRMGYMGKTHSVNTEEWDDVFDLYADINHYLKEKNIPVHYPEKPPLENLCAGISEIPAKHFPTNLLGDLSVRFLENRAQDNQPFFLMTAFEAPHSPWVIPREDQGLYDPDSIPLLEIPSEDTDKMPSCRREYLHKRSSMATDKQLQFALSIYYSLCTIMDRNVGKIVRALDRMGLRENTILFMLADHGDYLGNHRSMGKCMSLEDSLIHVPAIINSPQRYTSQTSDSLVGLIDIYPTIMDLAGIAPPTGLQGKSLVPILKGETSSVRKAIFSTEFHDHYPASICVRDERYKLVVSSDGFEELYDVQNDPHEWRNLIERAELDSIKLQLKDLLIQYIFESLDRTLPSKGNWVKNFLTEDNTLY